MAESTTVLRPVPAVDKAARVLRALADGGRPMGISELARALDVSKGTLRDVLLTLALLACTVLWVLGTASLVGISINPVTQVMPNDVIVVKEALF